MLVSRTPGQLRGRDWKQRLVRSDEQGPKVTEAARPSDRLTTATTDFFPQGQEKRDKGKVDRKGWQRAAASRPNLPAPSAPAAEQLCHLGPAVGLLGLPAEGARPPGPGPALQGGWLGLRVRLRGTAPWADGSRVRVLELDACNSSWKGR